MYMMFLKRPASPTFVVGTWIVLLVQCFLWNDDAWGDMRLVPIGLLVTRVRDTFPLDILSEPLLFN